MTTMASSTTRPVASVMPKSVSVLMENPSSLTKINVPTSDTGMVIAGNERAAPVLQKNKDDGDDEYDGFEQSRQHVANAFADRISGVESQLVFQAWRKIWEPAFRVQLLPDGPRPGRSRSEAAGYAKPMASWPLMKRLLL